MNVDSILSGAAVRSIDEVVAVMTALDECLPDDDGVKWFNRLYLRVTSGVRATIAEAVFEDAAFLTRLDVGFANLYFSALAAGTANVDAAPPAWRPLLQERRTAG